MTSTKTSKAIVSTRGQVTLPKAVRLRRQWLSGTRLLIEETPEGVLLRAAPAFPRTESADVFGSLAYDGPPESIDAMNAGILDEARRRQTSD